MDDNSPFPRLHQELKRTEGTVDGLYRRAVERFPQRTFIHALNDKGEVRVTYHESAQQIAAIALRLQELRFAAQDRIICYLEEQLPSVWFFLACAHLGLVPIPISAAFSASAVRKLAERVGAPAVFTVPELAPGLAKSDLKILCLPCPGTKIDGVVELNMEPLARRQESLGTLSKLASGHSANSVYYIQPTSGSTGEPKLAVQNHRSIVRGLFRAIDIRPEDEPPQRMLMITPLTHGNGQSLFMTTLYLAAELAIPTGVGTSASLDEIRRLDPTYINLVPRILRELYQQHLRSGAGPDDRLFGANASVMVISGAAPDNSLLRIVARQGTKIIPACGSSETGPIAVGKRGAWREGYVGTVLPDVEVKFASDGELLVRSPGLMQGYYGDEELTQAAFTEDGFCRTGDYAKITADGYFGITGRKKDIFNTYDGSNIYPARIEERIEGLPWVRQVVLIGDQRPYVVALIVPQGEFASAADGDGFLSEAAHGPLYARARQDLERINQDFEPNEQVRAFALFGKAFPSELYTTPDQMKAKRNRREIERVYQERIEALYACPPVTARVPDKVTWADY